MSFNPPGSGGITRTPFQMFAQQPPAPNTPYQDIGYIVAIDYVARTMQVVIRGSSGPAQNLQILSSVSIGTSATPLVVPGNWAIIQRVGNSYYITGYQVEPSAGGSTPPVPSMLAAPSNFTIVQIGDTLYASWTPVPGAVAYEIYQNTTPSPTGATIANNGAAQTSGTTYSWALSPGNNSNLITTNPGFESGNFVGWKNDNGNVHWVISSTTAHSGTYSALMSIPNPNYGSLGGYLNPMTSVLYDTPVIKVSQNATYVFSWWHYLVANSSNQGQCQITVSYLNSAESLISSSLLYGSSTIDTGWTQSSVTFTTPANTVYIEIFFYGEVASGYTPFTLYVDDFSLVGQVAVQATNFYAVRALGSFSGQASPFTSWLQPVVQSAALGTPASPHLQQNYTAAAIHSSTLSPSTGVSISPNGFTDTGWNVPLISPTNAVAETWTYASAASFTVAGDSTGRYGKGTKIRLKQGGGYLYFYVLSSSYSAPNTTVTVTGGSDYSLSNAAITDNYYSYVEAPQSFPDWFNYTLAWISESNPQPSFGNATITTARFKLFEKNQVRCQFFFTSGSTTTYGNGTWYFSFPVNADFVSMMMIISVGRGNALRQGVAFNTNYPYGASVAAFALYKLSNDTPIGSGTSAWASGDTFSCHFTYTI